MAGRRFLGPDRRPLDTSRRPRGARTTCSCVRCESGAVALRLLDLTGGGYVSGTDHAGPGRELARVGIALAGEQGVSVAKVTALTVEHHFVPCRHVLSPAPT